jgi:hypothetical protein
MTATTVRAEEQTTQEATTKREANGHFAKGNKGGPGNPFARQVAALRQTLLNRTTQKDFEEVADELIKKAKTGDVAAIKLLFQYTLGKPAPCPDPDDLDVDEWHRLQKYSRVPAEMSTIFSGLPADLACDVAKVNWPFQTEMHFTGPFRRGLEKLDKRDARKAAKAASKEAPSPKRSNGAGSATGVAPLTESQIDALDASLVQQVLRQERLANGKNGDAETVNGKRPA